MYRVKEIDGVFIPQKGNFLIGWEGIDEEDDYSWSEKHKQIKYCAWNDLYSARKRIESYKIQIKKPKIKYHKAK